LAKKRASKGSGKKDVGDKYYNEIVKESPFKNAGK
jgi:hypothetical protein